MKIFATSDLHGNYKALQKIIDYLNSQDDIDTVIFCGDIAKDYNCSTVNELSELQQEDYLCFKTMINEIKDKKVYYILGNHDVFLVDKNDMNYLPNAISEEVEGVFIPFEKVNMKFYGSDREGDERELKEVLDNICNINKEKIIVSHAAPYRCLDKSISGQHYGSRSIREMILTKSPLVFLCGHIHEEYGVNRLGNTFVVNCACGDFENRGIVFDIASKKYEEISIC